MTAYLGTKRRPRGTSIAPRWDVLSVACELAIVGVWIEEGMGLVVPSFVPTLLGEVFEYGDLRHSEPAPAPVGPPP